MIRKLEEVLAYRNDEVVHRFSADHKIPLADAEEIFLETKRWLWLCASETKGQPVPLLSEARALDMMWHTFLIFTKDYAKFCDAHFGFFVHHQPRTQTEKDAWERRIRESPEEALRDRRQLLRGAYEDVCNRLGSATLRKWCDEFPARFHFNE